ncbi:MAG TPA: hypothetical protein PKD64_17995 [Pirellulaceae bacterium]|nr:hypothetical protein [Pirellulaceae bacterium]HMO94081.1 hypothetical protein [Pirellulaceae bacterium]HMP71154.1 hypothetical protein [Pirellulaceae bacterium]
MKNNVDRIALLVFILATCILGNSCRRTQENSASMTHSADSSRELGSEVQRDSSRIAKRTGGTQNRPRNLASAANLNSIERGVQYLLAQQHEDGAWRSEYYGNLKNGAGLTAFVLYAIAHAKPFLREWPENEFNRGVESLIPNIVKFGYVTNDDGPDYSNYGSASLLRACHLGGVQLPMDVETKLVMYLIQAQLGEEDGFADDQPDFGGWDLSGWMTGHRMTTGTNISVSAFVIESLIPYLVSSGELNDRTGKVLASSGFAGSLINKSLLADVEKCLVRAANWTLKLQNRRDATGIEDAQSGGFFFHPKKDHDGNKAEWVQESRTRPRSYGTATADGFRSLVVLASVLGRPDSSEDTRVLSDELMERASEAKDWLARNESLDMVPGFDWESSEQSWREGLRYYYWFSRSKAYRLDSLLFEDPNRDSTARHFAAMKDHIETAQNAKGYWQNRNARMREDDPIIATSFAVIALSQLQQLPEKPEN